MTSTLGRLRQLSLEHLVGAERVVELEQRHVADDAGEVDGGLDTGVASADHRHALALEQGAVAVGAEGHALVAVVVLAGYVHLAPAGTGGRSRRDLDRTVAPLSSSTVISPPGSSAGIEPLRPLEVHEVDVVLLDVLLERGRERSGLRCSGTETKFSIAMVSSTCPPKRSAAMPVRMPLRAA